MPTSRSYIEQISHNDEMMMKKVFNCLFCFVCLFNFSSRFWVRFPPSDNIISLSYSMPTFSANSFGLFMYRPVELYLLRGEKVFLITFFKFLYWAFSMAIRLLSSFMRPEITYFIK